MKTKRKALLVVVCVLLLVAVSVMGTAAYLTDRETAVNTFTVGDIELTLDEAKVDIYGKAVTPAERVKANTYKLLPGYGYTKDPTVTVKKDSESCYVKATVTVTKAAALDAVYAPDGAGLIDIFNGYDSSVWIYKGNKKDPAADTRTYEFWYKDVVDASEADVMLDPLFDSFTVPETITGVQLATIDGMTLTCNAYAIQSGGFDSAEDAWAAFC